MSTGLLDIDLAALAANWRALDAKSGPEVRTAAVVKADGYGLGVSAVAQTLARAGARRFFVAVAEEGVTLRRVLGEGPEICVFSGHMAGDTTAIRDHDLIPMLNDTLQLTRHVEALPGHPFGVQLDTGMNRLGMEAAEWVEVVPLVLELGPMLLMSHLACADEPAHPMNETQLSNFRAMTDDTGVPRSLSATGGILLGRDYHFDVTRPGIGLYGGRPFEEARPVVRLSLPVIQTRYLAPGETVGYGNTWTAKRPTRLATVASGYADGISRHLSNGISLFHGETPCPLVGRVSMDLLTIDVTALSEEPETLDLLCPAQGIDAIADAAQTIGYEVLTQLGRRYGRRHRQRETA
ncbi:alanine racemase [Brevirhabdus sp.]|uniref:alanine racemase n=1 Tax=Brevirhabdus sp. TaxID=2004514 RepID=UPI0040598C9C